MNRIMIIYDLVCRRHHRFEGWFSSAEDFASQRERALVRCPLCDDPKVERRPSAQVRVGRAAPPAVAAKPEKAKSQTEPKAGEETMIAGDAKALELIRRLVAKTENVGWAFAEEARKIHYEEAPARGIRGNATPEDAESLREEGIDFLSLPAILTRDLN